MSDTPPRNAKAELKAAKAYAKAERPFYKKKRFIIPAAIVVIAAISMGGSGGDDGTADDSAAVADTSTQGSTSNSKSEKKAEKKAEKPAKKAMPVDAAALLKEFQDNEAAADLKYKGKLLRVTGTIDKVDTELLDDDEYVIRLAGGGDFEITTVNCDDQKADDVAALSKGQDLTVVGEFEDGGDLGIELKKCKIA